ncbi:MAG TPA: hypothetical protein GXX20_05475 [Clostridiaceae bacterium]|nr:hypothetical protein [Clostridiaceae bacterium]
MLDIEGTLVVNRDDTGYGTINITGEGRIQVDGSLQNHGKINVLSGELIAKGGNIINNGLISEEGAMLILKVKRISAAIPYCVMQGVPTLQGHYMRNIRTSGLTSLRKMI